MVLEYSKVRDKQYFDEFLNVSLFAKRIKKNPGEKIRGIISVLHTYVYISLILSALFIALFFLGNGPVRVIGSVGAVAALVGLVFSLALVMSFSLRIKEFSNVIEPQTLTIDEKGVRYEYASGSVEIKKKELACIVINKHSVCFLPKKDDAPIIGTGIEYRNKILAGKDKLGYASIITDNTVVSDKKDNKAKQVKKEKKNAA